MRRRRQIVCSSWQTQDPTHIVQINIDPAVMSHDEVSHGVDALDGVSVAVVRV